MFSGGFTFVFISPAHSAFRGTELQYAYLPLAYAPAVLQLVKLNWKRPQIIMERRYE
jgi:hypothetical protein